MGRTIQHRDPVLPPEVWNPILTQFRDWMSPATESPSEYIFGTAYTFAGIAIGRDAYIQMGRRIYANDFVCLLGSAGFRKGTPFALVHDEIILPHIDDRLGIRVVRGTGSAEGLLQTFMDELEEEDDKGRKRKVLKPVPECRVITAEEELGYFLVKAHREATANLREIACQLWDGVDVAPPTRSRSLRVQRPFYSMLSMTTHETLEARLDEDDILTGLLPRFMFLRGSMRPPLAWPHRPNHAGAKALAQGLEDIRAHAMALRRFNNGCLEPTQAAKKAWEEVYESLRKRTLEAPTPAMCRMLTRIEIHIAKAALIYAICAGHSAIELEDLALALALGDYLTETAIEVSRIQMGSDIRKVEEKIVTLVERCRPDWVRVRDLQQKLSGRVDAHRFHQALRALIKLDVLEPFPPDAYDRPKLVRMREDGRD